MSDVFANVEDSPYHDQSSMSAQQPMVDTKMTQKQSNIRLIVILALVGLILLTVGILIGYFSAPSNSKTQPPPNGAYLPGVSQQITQDGDITIRQKLHDEIKAENIEKYHKNLTKHPHLAGTAADLGQAQMIAQHWTDLGFDEVKIVPYDVLLSYPNESQPNQITLFDGNTVVYQSQLIEKIVRPDQNQSDVVPPFNAYSKNGEPEGDLIYVNYGRIEDFTWLKENKSINFTDKIVIARYGRIFRGDKVTFAQRFGAKGVILYSDPADYAIDSANSVYPNSWWLPGTGVQRGTTMLEDGDPLTPGYPAINSSFRLSEEETELPKIPVHPIGYTDAESFLKHMKGEDAPAAWQGKLNISYKIGPGFEKDTMKIKMKISTRNQMRTTYNVIGFIKGQLEPDRYVLLGNHRDAWVFGAVDPSSGTASLMEITRAFGQMTSAGWRPRRTLVFCSWGAEEFGLLGSTEWVENYVKNLGNRVIAYLNIDISVQGNYSLRGRSTPLLYKTLYSAAKQVKNPNPQEVSAGRETVYDTWIKSFPKKDKNIPYIGNLGSGSDYTTFLNRIGVPCLDTRYTYNTNKWKMSSYPLYHSVYETYHLMSNYIDPGFKYNQAVTRLWGEMARSLSDQLVLPMNVTDYAITIQAMHFNFISDYGPLIKMKKGNFTKRLDYLREAVDTVLNSAKAFEVKLQNLNRNNPLQVRMVNDQIIQLERSFIDPAGLPGRPLMRHLLFAPSSHNSYAGASFPGLVDSLFDIEKDPNPEKRWKLVEQQLAVMTFTLQSAASTLNDVVKFHT